DHLSVGEPPLVGGARAAADGVVDGDAGLGLSGREMLRIRKPQSAADDRSHVLSRERGASNAFPRCTRRSAREPATVGGSRDVNLRCGVAAEGPAMVGLRYDTTAPAGATDSSARRPFTSGMTSS